MGYDRGRRGRGRDKRDGFGEETFDPFSDNGPSQFGGGDRFGGDDRGGGGGGGFRGGGGGFVAAVVAARLAMAAAVVVAECPRKLSAPARAR